MEYGYDKDGNKEIYARYDRRYMPTLKDIFPEERVTGKIIQWKTAGIDVRIHFNIQSKSALVRRIFNEFLIYVLELVAEGNTVMMPGQTGSYISLKPIPDKEVKLLRQTGKYKDYNIVRANFKIPKFVYDFGPGWKRPDMQIYPTRRIQNLALRNAESGKFNYIEYRKI